VNSAGARPLAASEIAALTGGRLVGPGTTTVAGIAPLERAGPGDLSFLASPRYVPYLERSSASVVLVAPDLEQAASGGGPETRVIVADPYAALLVVLPVLYPQAVWEAGVHPRAVVGRGATWQEPVEIGPHAVLGHGVQLGRNVRIGAGCVLGDGVAVGDDSQLYPGVTLYAGTALGKRVIVHSGAVIGSDGFGYIPGKGGEAHRKIPHVGRCLIGDDIEIGANTCIDRGSVDDTVIGSGTKIDNLVHIAHNVRIGARCLIMAQAGIAGSCQVEDDVIIAGQAGVSDHITIGRGARLLVQSGTIADIPAEATYFGTLARPHREYLRGQVALYRLANIIGDLEELVNAKSTLARPAPPAPSAPPAPPAGAPSATEQ
jgi:UDP-3-O-[3-hydroxymyristoyl] glucosamine N-acyltransferase